MDFYGPSPDYPYIGTVNDFTIGVTEQALLTTSATGVYEVDLVYSGSGNIWLDVFEGTGPLPTITHDVLSTSTPLNGSIAASGDFGWYAIDLTSGNQYQFDLGAMSSLDGQLWLYDSNNNLLASADNGWASGLAETLFYIPPSTDTYYLSVSGYDITTGSFTLTTTSNPMPTTDFVFGDASTDKSLPVNNTLWGKIDDAADADWYSTAMTAGHTYRFDLTVISPDLDGILQFFDTDGLTLLGTEDSSFSGGSEYVYVTPTVSGNYYIAVDGFSTSTGEFYLTSTDATGYTGSDVAGDTTTTAALTQHVGGKIEASGDADWYAVSLTAGTQYQFDLGSAQLDGILALYDASGSNELAYADNGWGDGLPETLLYTPTANGTYYIGVSGYGGSTGDFLLDLASVSTGGGTDQVGSTIATAANLAPATNAREAVNIAGDEDWYHVSLTAGTTYQIDLTSNVLDGTLTLYGSNGDFLNYRDYGYWGDPEQLIVTPGSTGDYYISVGGAVSSTGDYNLSFNALTAPGGEIAGNSATTATLPVPGFATSTVDAPSDADWFSVRMDGGSEYRFDLYTDTNLDGILSVYDANGALLDYADYGWFAGDSEYLYFTPATTGNYFIEVSGFGSSSGVYDLYSAQTYDATQVTWTDADYGNIKWDVIDWSAFDWNSTASNVDWGEIYWTQLTDYSSLDWDYIDWTEFDASDYSDLDYEQIDWDELSDIDWDQIDWTQIFADNITWDHLKYENEYDPSSPGYGTGWTIDTSANAGNDNVLGGLLDDFANLGAGLDYFDGGNGDDEANGGAGADFLSGGAGNDTLNGGAGNDQMQGGAGDDIYYVNDSGDVVFEADNAAAIPSGPRTSLDLGSNIDKVVASISYTLSNYVENLDLAAGSGSLNGTGNALANTINGNESANRLDGGADADTLTGGAGNDTLTGGAGNDTLTGGAGNDIFEFDPTASPGVDLITDFTAGDRIRVSGMTFTENSIGIGDGSTVGNNQIQVASNGGVTSLFIGTNGTAGADLTITLTGTFSASTLTASGTDIEIAEITDSGNHILTGGDGPDILNGGDGADKMTGGDGDDTYIVDNSGDKVIEKAGEGTDEVQASISYKLGPYVENLTLTDFGDISGTGNELVNVLTGNAGNNLLDGGKGIDTMIGGQGDDIYILDDLTETVTEFAGEGTDEIRLKITSSSSTPLTYTLGSHIENLAITGTALLDIIGNAEGNVITGNSKNNTLSGLAGADTLDGGKGADTLIGGAGNDVYVIDSTQDVVNEEANADSGDLIRASININLSAGYAGIEHVTLTGKWALKATGDDGDNTLTGNDGVNTLDGGAGADALLGGKGNDTYVVDDVGDVVTEDLNAGTDLVKSAIDYTLTDNVENLTLTGSGDIDGTGNALKNVLLGNDGDNVLDGGDGIDSLKGGNGDDTYVVDLVAVGTGAAAKAKLEDSVTEAATADSGNDTLSLRAGDLVLTNATTLALGKTLENIDISATGSNLLNLTGNAAANEMTGNDAVNKLDGGLGNDTLTGGLGNDVFIFSKALNAATNVDSITDFSTAGDSIQLSKAVFKAVGAAGELNAAFFCTTDALTAEARIIFDSATGALFYDADGTGTASSQVQFATVTLTGIGSLDSSNFVVA